MAGLYNKVIELEKKLNELTGGNVSANVSSTSDKIEKLQLELTQLNSTYNARLTNVENKKPEVPPELTQRLTTLEGKVIPPDLSDRMLAVESKQVPDSLYERIDNLEKKQIPPDVSVRVTAIEARLTEYNNINLFELSQKVNVLEETITNLKQAFLNLDDKLNSVISPPPPQ